VVAINIFARSNNNFKIFERNMKRPIPKSTLLRFPLIFGGFLGFVGLGLLYKESWMGNIERTRNQIFEKSYIESNPIDEFKKEVAAKR
jgi:hypothetical protein